MKCKVKSNEERKEHPHDLGTHQDCCKQVSWLPGHSFLPQCSDAVLDASLLPCSFPKIHGTGRGFHMPDLQHNQDHKFKGSLYTRHVLSAQKQPVASFTTQLLLLIKVMMSNVKLKLYREHRYARNKEDFNYDQQAYPKHWIHSIKLKIF